MKMLEPISTFFSSMAAKIGFMALFGALANTIHAKREGRTRTKVEFLLNWIMSSFFGVVIGFVGLSIFKENIYALMAMAGTGGWLGIETTELLKQWLFKITNNKPKE